MSERRGDRAALGSRPSLQIRERRYVAFTTQELDALEQQATQAIEITEFLPIDAIDPIYYEHPCHLGPSVLAVQSSTSTRRTGTDVGGA